jgi:hypothetical protein
MKYLIILFSFFLISCADAPKDGNTIPISDTDLLGRVINVLTTFNLADAGYCSFDTDGYNLFAIPHIFESGIEGSNYIALNFTGDISIWTRGFSDYDRPGSRLLNVTQLSEVFLKVPLKLDYNGLLGEDHGLYPGMHYYIVIKRDEAFRLTTGCEGGILPFGRKLASKDGGFSWIGHNNNTAWFRKSGVIRYTTD